MRTFVFTILLLLGVVATDVRAQVNKRYFVWVGRDMVMENRYREAIETLNILLRADPEAYEGYFWRGIAKYNLDDLLGAERDFTITLAKNPVYTMAYQFRALTRSRMGNYDDAMKDFQEAIDLRPDYPAPYYSRGVANILTRRYAEAVADFDMYLRFNPRDADGYANRGMAYLNLRDTTAAYADFERAISTNRNDPRGYLERGALYMAQERYDEALADFDRAVACDTTYTAAYFNRALARYQKHQLTAALADFDRVLALDPTSSVTYFNRALLRTEIGDYNRALEDYDNVTLYSPGNVMVYYNRAGLYARLGDFRAAEADYDRAIELYPDFANAYLGRAAARFMQRNTKGAEADQRTAERKIAEYRARLTEHGDETSYADTTRRFDRLLSFDTNLSEASLRNAVAGREQIALRPLYKFTLHSAEETPFGLQAVYNTYGLEEMLAALGNDRITFSCTDTDLAAVELIRQNAAAEPAAGRSADWQANFLYSITQLLCHDRRLGRHCAGAAEPLPLPEPQRHSGRDDRLHLLDGQRILAPLAGKRPLGPGARILTHLRLRRGDRRPEQGGQTGPRTAADLLQPGQPAGSLGTLPGSLCRLLGSDPPRPALCGSLLQPGPRADLHEGYPQGAARHQQGGRTGHSGRLCRPPALRRQRRPHGEHRHRIFNEQLIT